MPDCLFELFGNLFILLQLNFQIKTTRALNPRQYLEENSFILCVCFWQSCLSVDWKSNVFTPGAAAAAATLYLAAPVIKVGCPL
jgi:hypothetical protein